MPFRFKLEALLRVRRIREEQQRGTLLASITEAERLRQQLVRSEQMLSTLDLRRSQSLASGACGAELQFESGCREQVTTSRQQQQRQFRSAELRTQQAREQFLALRRDRRLVEALGERWRREFEHKQQKKEESLAGELHLLRRGQKKRSGMNLPSE